MRKFEQLYEHLQSGPAPACDQIVCAGLALAEPEYFDQLVGLLLRRASDVAWAGLLEHWPRLTDDVQELLQADEATMLAAIARAMRGSGDARYHALLALRARPRVGAAYLLPAALRDPVARVRDTAADCFALVASQHCAQMALVHSGQQAPSAAYAEEHEQMVAGVVEVLATLETHLRPELVEACLWFATELGEQLWDRLQKPAARLTRIVTSHLESWNSPRLAGFLLLALRSAEWRLPAQKLLREWQPLEFGAALLRNTPLLGHPETASGVAVIRETEWLTAPHACSPLLPPALRPCLPAWIAHAGLPEAVRRDLLEQWVRRGDPDSQAAAIAALPLLERGAGLPLLRQLAAGEDELGELARAALEPRAQRAAAAPSPATAPLTVNGTTAAPGAPASQPADRPPDPATATNPTDEFLRLWQACRRAQGPEREALLKALRQGIAAWEGPLLRHAQSPDARDRMQLLRVLDPAPLRLRFAGAIQALQRDGTSAVSELAQRMLAEVGTVSADPQA